MIKVLKSAAANAENNFEMDPDKLPTSARLGANARPHPQERHAESRVVGVPYKQAHQPRIMIAVAERVY